MGLIDDTVWTLFLLYIVLGLISLYQYLQLVIREDILKDSSIVSIIFYPSSIQQQVHLTISLFSIIRISYFVVAIYAWDPSYGEVSYDKVAFYSLDSTATILFFTLACVLSLFWAELYYISRNDVDEYNLIIKPTVYIINVLAFVSVGICSYLVKLNLASDIYYTFRWFTIIICVCYIIAAVTFTYYANATANELKQVPVHLATRRHRLSQLRFLGFIVISALIVKACILFSVSGRSIPTVTAKSIISVFLYYFGLEIVPVSATLLFYRVEPLNNTAADCDDDVSNVDPMEFMPITSGSCTADETRNKYMTSSPKPQVSNLSNYKELSAPIDLVNSVIAGLSNFSFSSSHRNSNRNTFLDDIEHSGNS